MCSLMKKDNSVRRNTAVLGDTHQKPNTPDMQCRHALLNERTGSRFKLEKHATRWRFIAWTNKLNIHSVYHKYDQIM